MSIFNISNASAALDYVANNLEIGHTTVTNRSGILYFEDGISTVIIGHTMSSAGNWYYIISYECAEGRRVFNVNEWEPEYRRIFDLSISLSL